MDECVARACMQVVGVSCGCAAAGRRGGGDSACGVVLRNNGDAGSARFASRQCPKVTKYLQISGE